MKKTLALSALALSLIIPSSAEAKALYIETAGKAPVSVESDGKTVGEVIVEKGIDIPEGYVPFPSASEDVPEDGMVRIEKGITVRVKDGEKEYLRSVKSDRVEDILNELKITLGENDSVTPPLDGRIGKGEILRINRQVEETVVRQKPIDFETITRENPNLYKGESKVVQEGVKGVTEETRLVTKVNGEERGSIVIGSKILSESRSKIVEVGTKKPENMIHGKKYKKKIVMRGTAYDPSAGKWTASGTRARVGAVAVDPRVIPLGTKLYIESADGFPTYGFAVAEDTGGAIKGNRIDVFYNSRSQALRFGRRNVVVYILED
nr:3D domain-containing protein [uncultured Peptoniphilus sp.]